MSSDELARSPSTGKNSSNGGGGRHHYRLAARLTGSLRRSGSTEKSSAGGGGGSSSSKSPVATAEAKYDVSLDYPDLDLHSAAAAGNVGLVHYALTHGQPINSVLHGVLPLHAACAGGSEPIVRMLIDRGADVNAPRLPRRLSRNVSTKGAGSSAGVSGSTPLHFAAANGHSHIVRILLACGAVWDKRDKQGNTPESLASKAGHQDVVHTLETWQDMLEDEKERIKVKEEEKNRLERETYPDASTSTSSSSRKSLEAFHRREDTGGGNGSSTSTASAGSSRRPSLPSIFEKATHPGAAFKTAFRRPSAAAAAAAAAAAPAPLAVDAEPAPPRGRPSREDDRASVASSRQLSRQSLLHLFHKARRDHSPGSESPSPPRGAATVVLPPEELEESIERIRRASIDGSPSKNGGRRSRSGTYSSSYRTAQEEEEGDVDDDRVESSSSSPPTHDRNKTAASPPSSPLARSFGPDDPPSSSEDDHLPISDRTLRPPNAGRDHGRSPLRLDISKTSMAADSSRSLQTSPLHMDAAMPPQPPLAHSEPTSPTLELPSDDMRRTPSEGSPSHSPSFHRTDSTSSNRVGRIRLGTRSRGASLSSVASSIVALQQIDGRTVAIVDPTTLRDAVVSGKRQWSTSSASSALSGFGFGSVAGTSYTPPSTLSSHEQQQPQQQQQQQRGSDVEPPLPKERLARKLSKRKTQSPAMLYNLPMASTESVSRRVSSRDEARELVKKSEQDLLAALCSGPNPSSASLAEQLAAYGDSLALEQQFSAARPSLTKQDSTDSNVTVTTESSKPSASRSYVDSSSYAKGTRAASFTASSSVVTSASTNKRNETTRRSLNEPRPLSSTIYLAQAPSSIPSINRIYETRAAAYREQGLALRNSAPIYSDTTRRHSSNPVHSHWIMTDVKTEGRNRRKVSGESSSRDGSYLPSVVGSPRSQDTVGPLAASSSLSTVAASAAATASESRRRRSREAVRQTSLGPPPGGADSKHRTSPSSSRRNSLGRELDRLAPASSSQEPSPEKHSLRVVSDALAAAPSSSSTAGSAPKHSKWTDSIKFKSPFSRNK